MTKIKIFFLFLLLLGRIQASSLFVPDSDTAALIAVASNTASTVAHTLELLEVAQQTKEQIEKYNELAQRRLYRARRIEQHMNDLSSIKKMNVDNLENFNRALAQLKSNLNSLESELGTRGQAVVSAEKSSLSYKDKLSNSLMDEKEVHNQELASSQGGPMSSHVQNTAINTSLNGKILSKMRRDSLEYQKSLLGLEKSHAVENLRREQFYKNWLRK